MRKNSSIFCLYMIILCTTSCIQKRFVYAPSPPDYPFFSKKGQSKVAAYFSQGPSKGINTDSRYNRGYDLQGAYAISDNWAATLNFTKRKELDTYSGFYDYFDSSVIRYNRLVTEIGLGYFSSAHSGNPTYSIYGGIGFGKFRVDESGRANDSSYARFLNTSITKYYLQPGVSFNVTRNFFMAFALRLSLIKYHRISTTYTADEKEHFKFSPIQNTSPFFGEPSIIFQYEIPSCKWIKAEADLTLDVGPANINYRGSNASFGLVFDFSKLNSRKK